MKGVQFLDNIAEVPVPEWTIRKVRIICNSVNYEFVTNLFLPDIRYKPNETKSVFINSITSDYDPNSLKLEVLTGSNFITAYTTLDLEFFTLRGTSTGKITIPAEEVCLLAEISTKILVSPETTQSVQYWWCGP